MAEYYEVMTDEERRARDMKEAGIEVKSPKESRRSKLKRSAKKAAKEAYSRAKPRAVGAAKYAGRKVKAGAGYAGRKIKEQAEYRLSPEAQEKRKARLEGLMNKAKGSAPRSAKRNKRKKAARSRRAPQQEHPLGLGFDLGAGNSGGGWFDEPAQKRGKTSVNDSYGFYWGEPKRKGKKQKRQQQQSWF